VEENKMKSFSNTKFAVAGAISIILVLAIVLATQRQAERIENDSELSNDTTYLAAQDAVAHMQSTEPCAALAHTMIAYASDLTLPQGVREAQVYNVMKKATQHCM
jgi:hypothetical protein